MNRMLPAKLAFAALLLPALAMAKTSDRNQPMAIDSNANDCNMLDDSGKCRFSGNVVITQGTLEIHADTADIFQKNGQTDRVVLTGKQATLKQQMDDGAMMNGQADNIEYQVANEVIVLTGNYKVDSPKGTNAGQRMVYNTKTGNMQSGGDGSRVRTIIQPKTAAPAAATPAATPAAKPAAKPQGRSNAGRHRSAQEVQATRSGQGIRPHARGRRSGRPARPQRCRQDHLLLHDRRPGRGRCRAYRAGRTRPHRRTDVRPRQARCRLSAAGAVDLPQAHRGRQHPPGAGACAKSWMAPAARRNWSRCWKNCRSPMWPTSLVPACPAASGGAARSRGRWRPSRA